MSDLIPAHSEYDYHYVDTRILWDSIGSLTEVDVNNIYYSFHPLILPFQHGCWAAQAWFIFGNSMLSILPSPSCAQNCIHGKLVPSFSQSEAVWLVVPWADLVFFKDVCDIYIFQSLLTYPDLCYFSKVIMSSVKLSRSQHSWMQGLLWVRFSHITHHWLFLSFSMHKGLGDLVGEDARQTSDISALARATTDTNICPVKQLGPFSRQLFFLLIQR